MALWQYGLGFSLALGVGLGFGAGCAAGAKNNVGGTGGVVGAGGTGTASNNGGGGALPFTTGTTGTGVIPDSGVPDGLGACAMFSAEAKQAPAAMLIVLDRTASMSQQNKWGTAQIAIVQAIDKDVFDTMSLGMLTFPAPNSIPGPACIFNFPIYCDVSALPQVPVQAAGTNKSSAAMGVRHDIYQYLVSNGPESADMSDSSPIYASLNGAYQFIKTVPNVDKRMVVLITDGGGSCTSVSSPQRPAYTDANGCMDWELPDTMNTLIKGARTDPAAPINTFIVGVPGSNSHGETVGSFDTPPYSMLLALSTYAVSGSPGTVDPACDSSAVFMKPGTDPAKPCHIDLSNGANFNANALSDAIANLRGAALGCTYDLPPPPMGQTINDNEVNVVVTVNGQEYTIPRRSSPSDMCLTTPCWDYDAQGKVDLIGITCTTVSTSASAKVEIYVGCATILK